MNSVFKIAYITVAICAAHAATGCGTSDATTPIAVADNLEAHEKQSAVQTGTITIAAVGDILLGSTFPNDSRMPPNDGADLLKDVTPILSEADIAFGNMEGPIIDGGVSEKCPPPKIPKPLLPGEKPAKPEPIRCFAFRMPTRYAKYLKAAGFDVLSVANNHALDFGDEGRTSTRKTLDELGIGHAGSDRTRFSTTYLEVENLTVAFIGFAHNAVSPNVNELAAARRFVLEADKKADIVVVSFHGGAEGVAAQRVPQATEIFFTENRGNLPLFARTVIDAGADLVLGHGPHVLRGMEIYKDRLIAYSLGNFATYGWFSLKGETALTMILETTLNPDGSLHSARIHPAKQVNGGVPVRDASGAAIKKVRQLSNADFAATAPKIADDGTIHRP
ncbi:MAG: CapA family protein [Pyrinomonadaceae bacterium]